MADSKTVLRNALALMLAVRCRSKEGTLQLLGRFYDTMDEQQVKTMMNRTIYLLNAQERDWMKGLI